MSTPEQRKKIGIASLQDIAGGQVPVYPSQFPVNFGSSKPSGPSGNSMPSLTPEQAYKMNALEDIGYSAPGDRAKLKQLSPEQKETALEQEHQGALDYQDLMESPEGSKDEDDALNRMYASSKTKSLLDN